MEYCGHLWVEPCKRTSIFLREQRSQINAWLYSCLLRKIFHCVSRQDAIYISLFYLFTPSDAAVRLVKVSHKDKKLLYRSCCSCLFAQLCCSMSFLLIAFKLSAIMMLSRGVWKDTWGARRALSLGESFVWLFNEVIFRWNFTIWMVQAVLRLHLRLIILIKAALLKYNIENKIKYT